MVAANDAACGLSCPADSECRSYGSGALTANCEAIGLCRATAECRATDAPAGTACLQGAGACDGQGECVVEGKKRLGEACADDLECGQGNCVVGSAGTAICCAGACGADLSCSADGTRCLACDADGARCDGNLVQVCAAGELTRTICGNGCDPTSGRYVAQRATGSVCEESAQCLSGACTLDVTGTQRCCDPSCAAAGRACATDGSCVCPAGRQDVCRSANECASGSCNRWYMDLDSDQHGDRNNALGVCGNAGERPPAGLVASSDDCCVRHPDVFPGQTLLFTAPQSICPDSLPFGYNCDGVTENRYQDALGIVGAIGRCIDLPLAVCEVAGRFTTWFGMVPTCGASGSFAACEFAITGGVPSCNSLAGGSATNACR